MLSKNFSDLVTFTRASGGTSFRPVGRGTLVNQLLWSGDFTNVAWTKTELGLTANQPGPSGANDAVLLTETATSGIHQVLQVYSAPSVGANTFAAVVKYAGKSLDGFGGNWNFPAVQVDLQTGVVSGAAAASVTVASVGNGYWLIARADTVPDTASRSYITRTSSFGSTAGSGILLHRAALFTGVVTAQQIIDNGGIPITSSAPDNVVRIDNAGDPIQLFQVPANYPRRDYDPVTGACKGLLVEEQRTNSLLWSNGFTNAAWVKSPSGVGVAPQLSPQPVAAPDGTLTATRVTLTNTGTTSGDWSWLYSHSSCASGLTYCASAFVRASTPADVGKQIVWPGVGAPKLITLSADWALVENAAACIASTTYAFGPRLMGTETTATTVTLDICHAQVETGASATSRIPTTGAAATRSGDIAAVNTLAPWFNATEGTIAVDFSNTNSDAVDRVIFSLQSTSWVNNALHFRSYNSSGVIAGYNGATREVSMSLGALPVDNKTAVAFAANNFAACRNGGTVAVDTVGTVPPVTTLMIGSAVAAQQLNGHIRRIQYIPKRLSDAKLQVLTTLTYGAPYGPELVAPLNLTSGWSTSNATVIDVDTFTTTATGGVWKDVFTARRAYQITVSGDSTGGIEFRTWDGTTQVIQLVGFGTATFVAPTTRLYMRCTNAGTTNIADISVKEVTIQ